MNRARFPDKIAICSTDRAMTEYALASWTGDRATTGSLLFEVMGPDSLVAMAEAGGCTLITSDSQAKITEKGLMSYRAEFADFLLEEMWGYREYFLWRCPSPWGAIMPNQALGAPEAGSTDPFRPMSPGSSSPFLEQSEEVARSATVRQSNDPWQLGSTSNAANAIEDTISSVALGVLGFLLDLVLWVDRRPPEAYEVTSGARLRTYLSIPRLQDDGVGACHVQEAGWLALVTSRLRAFWSFP